MLDKSKDIIFNNILKPIKNKFMGIGIEYGILAMAASVMVPFKLLLFYQLIGVTSNLFFVWLITCTLTYLLFSSYKNKWIPTVIYILLTILMFCDVTYSSFFNRYLSVNMLGAAGFLGDITESIKEVLKPAFFLILADAVLIIAALIAKQKGTLQWKLKAETQEAAAPEMVTDGSILEIQMEYPTEGELKNWRRQRNKKKKNRKMDFKS